MPNGLPEVDGKLCLVYLPHSYAGRGPAESCVRICEHFPAARLETRLFTVRARKALSAELQVTEAIGPMGRYVPYRLLSGIGQRLLKQKFASALEKAPSGSIAYFWPGSPLELVERAKSLGHVTIREMINCPLAYAKPALDRAYRDAGFEPSHTITDEAVERENVELAQYDYFFAPNPEVERTLRDGGIAPEKILPTSYGWLRERFNKVATQPRSEHGGFRFCFVGLMNVRKGIPDLLAAWKTAGIDGELWLAGAIEPCLAQLVADATAEGSVKHFGHIDDVGEFYRQCDAFVFPTHEEGGPQVTIEAAICGLPVITTAMGAARIIEDGDTGLIVPIGNSTALAAAMRSMAADKKWCSAMGDKASQKAEQFEFGLVGRARAAMLCALVGE